ncbi:hypothetical protein BU26DRAFT_586500 [Trematosphaeria pertusa]|uniref:Uncharacterized protein n=1 Tax=Trematosphaeria pertusa TaxID=390896 RepID=A0A6A6HV41_9PLEO|nr:uncharacterized protein BU26DRAFT_586500 [Trematosphaeria pertusa]KAF2241300.1 hypothetical protein BU26DRAFT_586500 [Trematosphaeria pertusa]
MDFERHLKLITQKQLAENEKERLENEVRFHRMHAPCDPLSPFHDLKCGHRVKTQYPEDCGSNCKRPVKDITPIICPDCVTNQVRLDMELEGLTLTKDGDASMEDGDMARADKIKKFAETQIDFLVKHQYRLSMVVPKLDPKLQFFYDFPEAQENGGFVKEAAKREEEPAKRFKRPGIFERKPRGAAKPIIGNRGRPAFPNAQNPHHRGMPTNVPRIKRVAPPRGPLGHIPTHVKDPDLDELFRKVHAKEPPPPRPRTRSRSPNKKEEHGKAKYRRREDPPGQDVDDLAAHLDDTRVGILEDEATKAVREVLEAFCLGEKGNKVEKDEKTAK